jgi:hypothetical protein
MTQDQQSSRAKPSQSSPLFQLFSLPSSQCHNSERDDTAGRNLAYRYSTILHTQAKAVLQSHVALSEFDVDLDTLPPSTDWDARTAAEVKAWKDRQHAIDTFNMKVIIDQEAHGIPTSTELDGFEAGTVREEVEPSKAFLQLCTALSRDPTLNTKAKIVEWSEDQPEFSLLCGTLESGKWPAHSKFYFPVKIIP